MSSGHSLHKKDWLKIAGGLALAGTGLGAAGIGPMAGLFGAEAAGVGAGAGAATDASLGAAGLLNAAGTAGIGAGAGAATDASLGAAGLMNSTAPQAMPGLLDTIRSAVTSPTGKAVGNGFEAYQKTQGALDAMSPKQASAPMGQQRPQFAQGFIGQQSLDAPPTTPYSPYDPLWVAYQRRHPQGNNYG